MLRISPLRSSWRAAERGLLAALLTGLLTLVAPDAASAESAAAFMARVRNDLLVASRTGSQADFAAAMRKYGDVPAIGRMALGSYRASLPKAEWPTYFAGMVNYVSRVVGTLAPKYPVAKANIIAQSQETKAGIFVDTQVFLVSGEMYDVRWRIVRDGQGFKIRDAEVTTLVGNISCVEQLGKQFQDYITDNGGNPRVLVVALNR